MSNTYAVNGSTPATYSGIDAGMSNLSPDSLLAYCQAQLGDLDTQINDQMTVQKTALREREAVQSAQNVLQQFGTKGPQNATDMQKCVTAVDNAMAQLPPDDPVRASLADFSSKMVEQYRSKGRNLTAKETTQLTVSQNIVNEGAARHTKSELDAASNTIKFLTDAQTGSFQAPIEEQKQWQTTTDALTTLASDIKSGAEIQMLQLQDLVSQRQQAVQLCSGIMSKTDQTLEDQAKAIGRG